MKRLKFPSPDKVVLLRASRIGDFVCATPAFRALRSALPGAEITLAGQPFVAALAARCPYLDRFEACPGYPGMGEQFFAPDIALRFFKEMQAREFDLAVQMHGSGAYSNPFLLMLGAKTSAGFVREGEDGGLDAPFRYQERRHEVLRLLELVEFLGAPRRGEATEFVLWPQDHEAAREALRNLPNPLIGLHPGAREAPKRWPLSRFVEAARELHARLGGTLVAIGGEAERAAGEAIGGVNLAGLSIPVMGAVIARLSMLVTNDSGPAHIAYALGTPTLTLFGATSPEMWGPLDADRHATVTGDLERLTAPEVVARVERLYAHAG